MHLSNDLANYNDQRYAALSEFDELGSLYSLHCQRKTYELMRIYPIALVQSKRAERRERERITRARERRLSFTRLDHYDDLMSMIGVNGYASRQSSNLGLLGASSSNFRINDAVLPPLHAMMDADEEQTSTALGSIVHVVILLSKYFKTPLRYRLVYKASRSSIYDDADDQERSNCFPLFSKGQETLRFERGIFLLQANIELLLNLFVEGWQRKSDSNPQNPLEYVKILMEGILQLT
jgi:hypothetical protein